MISASNKRNEIPEERKTIHVVVVCASMDVAFCVVRVDVSREQRVCAVCRVCCWCSVQGFHVESVLVEES